MSSSISFNPVIIERRSDKLTVVEVADNSKITSREIANKAAKQFNFPNYTPDNASITLIFHTESGNFLLGGVRDNPALNDKVAKNGKPFPQQINATIGGYSPNPDLPFRAAAMSSIKNKMFLNSDLSGAGLEAQQLLRQLCATIEDNEGWENKICVHTDKWKDGNDEKTMSVLTAVKHIHCKESDKAKIDAALKIIMNTKKEEGAHPKTLSEFKFVELEPIIDNSLESHLEDEVTKATKAYDRFGDEIVVTFNDLAMATLSKNFAFKGYTFTHLDLSN